MVQVSVTSTQQPGYTSPVTYNGKTYYAQPGTESAAMTALGGGTCNVNPPEAQQQAAVPPTQIHEPDAVQVDYAGTKFWVDPMTAANLANPESPGYRNASKLVHDMWVGQTGGSSANANGSGATTGPTNTGNQQDIVTGLWSKNPVNTDKSFAETGKLIYTPTQNEFRYTGSEVAQAGGTSSKQGQVAVSKETAAHIANTDYTLYRTPANIDPNASLLATQKLFEISAEAAKLRPNYYGDAGDNKTAHLAQVMTMAMPGMSPFASSAFAVEITRENATGTRSKQYYGNELQKLISQPIEQASEYHYITKSLGKPAPANPWEYQADLAVELLKGAPQRSSEVFSPVSGEMSAYLPNRGYGLQQLGWDTALNVDNPTAYPAPRAVSFMPALAHLATAEGQYGPYGTLFGGPSYVGTPSSDGIRKQPDFYMTQSDLMNINAALKLSESESVRSANGGGVISTISGTNVPQELMPLSSITPAGGVAPAAALPTPFLSKPEGIVPLAIPGTGLFIAPAQIGGVVKTPVPATIDLPFIGTYAPVTGMLGFLAPLPIPSAVKGGIVGATELLFPGGDVTTTYGKPVATKTGLSKEELPKSGGADFTGYLINPATGQPTRKLTTESVITDELGNQKIVTQTLDIERPYSLTTAPILLQTYKERDDIDTKVSKGLHLPNLVPYITPENVKKAAPFLTVAGMPIAATTAIPGVGDYSANFLADATRLPLERPVTVAANVGIGLAGGAIFGAADVGLGALEARALSGGLLARGAGVSISALRTSGMYGLGALYGIDVLARTTNYGTDFSPEAAGRLGGMTTTEIIPGLVGFTAGYKGVTGMFDSYQHPLSLKGQWNRFDTDLSMPPPAGGSPGNAPTPVGIREGHAPVMTKRAIDLTESMDRGDLWEMEKRTPGRGVDLFNRAMGFTSKPSGVAAAATVAKADLVPFYPERSAPEAVPMRGGITLPESMQPVRPGGISLLGTVVSEQPRLFEFNRPIELGFTRPAEIGFTRPLALKGQMLLVEPAGHFTMGEGKFTLQMGAKQTVTRPYGYLEAPKYEPNFTMGRITAHQSYTSGDWAKMFVDPQYGIYPRARFENVPMLPEPGKTANIWNSAVDFTNDMNWQKFKEQPRDVKVKAYKEIVGTDLGLTPQSFEAFARARGSAMKLPSYRLMQAAWAMDEGQNTEHAMLVVKGGDYEGIIAGFETGVKPTGKARASVPMWWMIRDAPDKLRSLVPKSERFTIPMIASHYHPPWYESHPTIKPSEASPLMPSHEDWSFYARLFDERGHLINIDKNALSGKIAGGRPVLTIFDFPERFKTENPYSVARGIKSVTTKTRNKQRYKTITENAAAVSNAFIYDIGNKYGVNAKFELYDLDKPIEVKQFTPPESRAPELPAPKVILGAENKYPESPIVQGHETGGIRWNTYKTDVPFWDSAIQAVAVKNMKPERMQVAPRLTWMHPTDYIGKQIEIFDKRAPEGKTGRDLFYRMLDEEHVSEIQKSMLKGDVFDSLALEYDRFGKIKDFQEGRHRAVAAQRLGAEKIPVWETYEKEMFGEPGVRAPKGTKPGEYFLRPEAEAVLSKSESFKIGERPGKPLYEAMKSPSPFGSHTKLTAEMLRKGQKRAMPMKLIFPGRGAIPGRNEGISPEADAKQLDTMRKISNDLKPGEKEKFYIFDRTTGDVLASGTGNSSSSLSLASVIKGYDTIKDAEQKNLAFYHTHPWTITLEEKSSVSDEVAAYMGSRKKYPSESDIGNIGVMYPMFGRKALFAEEGIIAPGEHITAWRGQKAPDQFKSAMFRPASPEATEKIHMAMFEPKNFQKEMGRIGLDTQIIEPKSGGGVTRTTKISGLQDFPHRIYYGIPEEVTYAPAYRQNEPFEPKLLTEGTKQSIVPFHAPKRAGFTTNQMRMIYQMKNVPYDYGTPKSWKVPDPTDFYYRDAKKVPMAGTEGTGYPVIKDWRPSSALQKVFESGKEPFTIYTIEKTYGVVTDTNRVNYMKGTQNPVHPGGGVVHTPGMPDNVFGLQKEHPLVRLKQPATQKKPGSGFYSVTHQKEQPTEGGGGGYGRVLPKGRLGSAGGVVVNVNRGQVSGKESLSAFVDSLIFSSGVSYERSDLSPKSTERLLPPWMRKRHLEEQESEVYIGNIPGVQRPRPPAAYYRNDILNRNLQRGEVYANTQQRRDELIRSRQDQGLSVRPALAIDSRVFQTDITRELSGRSGIKERARQEVRTVHYQSTSPDVYNALKPAIGTRTKIASDTRTANILDTRTLTRTEQITRPGIKETVIPRPWIDTPTRTPPPDIPIPPLGFNWPGGGSTGGSGYPRGYRSRREIIPLESQLFGRSWLMRRRWR